MTSTWHHSTTYNCPCKLIEQQTIWGQTVCRVWLPNQDAVVRLPLSDLQPLIANVNPEVEAWRLKYLASAAKVAELLEGSATANGGHVLLAPMESNVIPLPHQITALSRAISGGRVRYLLADEVGLGKTIEAGLIMRELKLRGLVRRILVVAPKGLATQWLSEMQTHFNEHFQLLMGEDISTLQRLLPAPADSSPRDTLAINPWSNFDQVVVSLDSVKPMDKRRGWSSQRVAEYNRVRFEELITAGWDLVVVDEAHRLGGSTDQVARYKLGRGLAEAAPYVLLLSATPHQGKSDAFQRLMSLLDAETFSSQDSVSRERVAPYVIRTEKRKAITADGKPLFKPRRTLMAPIQWGPRHQLQQHLYEAVTEYVTEGYNQALKQKQRHIGFLMILMQRLVVSSTRAISTTLERRLEVLKQQSQTLNLFNVSDLPDADSTPEEIYDLDAQELLDSLINSSSAIKNEASHVEALLESARQCEHAGPDAKAEALIDWIYKLQSEENEPDLKLLIFTEFVPTQAMLKQFLQDRGISVVTLNGGMDMSERQRAQDAFSGHIRVLVSTDAGGEGLNLQFCHVIINYDIPWNPMRLEQRIGRVDRIGQPKTVRAINLVFESSVEFRVREVLEQKLAVIFEEFGIDKTGDVLDSAQAGELFEDVFTSAILNPDGIDDCVDQTVARIRDEMGQIRETSAIYGLSDEPDMQIAERLRSHPLPYWLEHMTVGYLNSHGGSAIQKRAGWDLTWPDGQSQRKCVFHFQQSNSMAETALLNLENNRIRSLALNIPQLAAGQSIPCVALDELPATISGWWGLFEIKLQMGLLQKSISLRIPLIRRGYICLFISEEGTLFLPTARHIWDLLLTAEPRMLGAVGYEQSSDAYERLLSATEQAGTDLFGSMQRDHHAAITREEERGVLAYTSRRNAIARVGLPEVRQHRLARCDADQAEWRKELESAKQIVPEIRPLLVMRIISGDNK